jgi:hypothetical protein
VAALVLGLGLVVLVITAPTALAAPQTSPLDVVITEIAWMGTTTSSYDEWIELHNNTTGPIDLTGWTLNAADGSPPISQNGTIPAGGSFLALGRGCGAGAGVGAVGRGAHRR